MRAQSVNNEVTKMMKILDEPTQKALTELANSNKELALMVQLYVYATEQGKISEGFVEQVQNIKKSQEYDELATLKEKQDYIDKNLSPIPYKKWFEDNDMDMLSMIRYIQDNIKEGIEYNPITYLFIHVDTNNEIFKLSAQEWLETHIEELKNEVLRLYKKFATRCLIGTNVITKAGYKDLIKDFNFMKTSKAQKVLLAKNGYKIDEDKYNTHNKKVIQKTMKYYADKLDKKYNKVLEKSNPQLKRFTYKSMVEDYFGNGFVFDDSDNAPKLSRQLSKAKIEYTQEEVRHFGEVRAFWNDWYSQNTSSLGNAYKSHGIYIDTENFKIPNIVDCFAFKDSCNCYGSSAGSDTHLILRGLGCQYVKGYSFYRYEGKLALKPSFRTYFFRDSDNNIAHAGSYSDGKSNYNYTNYEFTTVLLCILFGRKIDDFSGIDGLNINCKSYTNSNCDTYYFWSNMSNYNDYTTVGTCDNILIDFDENDLNKVIEKVPPVEFYTDRLSQEQRDKFLRYNHLIPITENTNKYFETKGE